MEIIALTYAMSSCRGFKIVREGEGRRRGISGRVFHTDRHWAGWDLTNKNNYYIVIAMETRPQRNKRMEVFYQRSRERRLKITPQRTLIYEELLKAKDHPTADDIHKRIVRKAPHISFDTVNRTLLTFSKIGITHVVEGYGQAKRYDPDVDTHHHFRCVRCGCIIDFHNKEYDDIAVPEEISGRFEVTRKKVVLEGLCGQCRKG
jgi:Fur family transcriptional regulator, peroxide stress response regulator